jgi:hypothetical protein
MFMASEPQTPSRQERRNDSVGSLRLELHQGVQQHALVAVELDLDGLHVGLGVLVRVVAVDLESAFLHGGCPAVSG